MQTTSRTEEVQRLIRSEVPESGLVGLVPTMGAFHEGHLSLFELARRKTDFVVATSFVNRRQFGPDEDYLRYPRDESDDQAAASAGVDLFFTPEESDVYPEGFDTVVEVGRLGGILCGIARPGHFSGVATVVVKLLNMVRPEVLFLGQKDYQQMVVLRKVLRDLDMGVEVVVGPTMREADGLAMSSRNRYLSPEERRAAVSLQSGLQAVGQAFDAGERSPTALGKAAVAVICEEPLVKLEYVSVLDPVDLEELSEVGSGAVALLAAQVGSARLIDNILLGEAGL